MGIPLFPDPVILYEGPDYAVISKPPGMFSAPLKGRTGGETLLDWYARRFPLVLGVRGRQPWEGGILHRLDRETAGLILFAKNQETMDALTVQQEECLFTKDYEALTANEKTLRKLPGFPPPPAVRIVPATSPIIPLAAEPAVFQEPRCIESAFRPYGKGARAVRPVPWPFPWTPESPPAGKPGNRKRTPALDRGRPYRTEINGVVSPCTGFSFPAAMGYYRFHIRIRRGFRHQIRCHLAWIGYPILNDSLYGGGKAEGYPFVALWARGIAFFDPRSGERREFILPSVTLPLVKDLKTGVP
ncbi:MAG: RNA pseudouridine synthase [Spirochaetaceae bacterium]|jgi:23S rRNA pseudouridine1911/1915/1917 synthase|nr:RNA pseudouridine synthase [Spirochaetaceae bacterium]